MFNRERLRDGKAEGQRVPDGQPLDPRADGGERHALEDGDAGKRVGGVKRSLRAGEIDGERLSVEGEHRARLPAVKAGAEQRLIVFDDGQPVAALRKAAPSGVIERRAGEHGSEHGEVAGIGDVSSGHGCAHRDGLAASGHFAKAHEARGKDLHAGQGLAQRGGCEAAQRQHQHDHQPFFHGSS